MSTAHPHMKTLTGVIKHDHQEMYDYYERFLASMGDADAQGRWAHQLVWEIARHAAGEEIVVYPLMETHLGPQGAKLADRDRDEHQAVKEALYRLESLRPGTADHTSLLEETIAQLREHNDSEEREDLPLLEPLLGADASKEAAAAFRRTKKFVPTRPHPSVPNKPPYETLVGFLAMPIDKLKDLFTSFPSEDEMDQ